VEKNPSRAVKPLLTCANAIPNLCTREKPAPVVFIFSSSGRASWFVDKEPRKIGYLQVAPTYPQDHIRHIG
jgi:type I site-specific restriction endonuclease